MRGADLGSVLALAGVAGSWIVVAAAPAVAAEAPAVGTAQRLVVPVDLPERFEVVVRLGDAFHTLRLERRSLRAPGFRIRLYETGGKEVEVASSPPATYRGEVVGMPEAVVAAGGDVLLSWSASCIAADDDYAVYEGVIGDFTSHVPAACTTGNQTSTMLTPQAGDRYFLVVPQSANREGGYGTDGTGRPRSPSTAPCRPSFATACP